MDAATRPGPLRGLIGTTAVLVLLAGADRLRGGPVAPASHDDDAAIRHVLNRLTFGPRPGDVAAVRAMGIEAYIERQLHPDRIDDTPLAQRLAPLGTLGMSTRDLSERYFLPALLARRERQQEGLTRGADASASGAVRPSPTAAMRATGAGPVLVTSELMQARLLRAALSERQLQEVLVDFWFNHFNVFIGKGQVRQHLTAYERDAIRPHMLGRFRDLLGAVAHSPAMLLYLDNWQSAAPNAPSRGRGGRLDRRPAGSQAPRALPRQTARGLNENYARELLELHTLGVDGGYTEHDVVELARMFTGWTIDRPMQGGPFVFRPAMHDSGTKRLLGVDFAASGEAEGERALDLLARHPATARHIARKLAQRFVADEPPAAVVDRAARIFRDTDGSLRDVVRAIVTSPEFVAPDARGSKVKTPLEFVISSIRATGENVTDARPLINALRTLGMPLYGCQPPTGYRMTADAWVNTGALLNRMNFAVALVGRGRTPLVADTLDASRNRVIDVLLGGTAAEATRATLARADSPATLVALALGSPEFQRK
jgi:uncharacterized protein (DUF1800 family)